MLGAMFRLGRRITYPVNSRQTSFSTDGISERHMSFSFEWVKYKKMTEPHPGCMIKGLDTSGTTFFQMEDGSVKSLITKNVSDDPSRDFYLTVGLTKNPNFNGEPGLYCGPDSKNVTRYLSDKGVNCRLLFLAVYVRMK